MERIPIKNIYYLLSYAWNKLEESERVKVAADDITDLPDLFAKILINATRLLLKRGIDRSYVEYTGEVAGIKGKLEISETIKKNVLAVQKTICTYDDLSADILSNRILFSTIYLLTKMTELDRQLKRELSALLKMFPTIQLIALTSSVFKKVQLNRNNRFYGFIMDVCQIIHENSLPSETKGEYVFTDFTRNKHKMNQLFEAFVRNFYKRRQSEYKIVKKETIYWQFTSEKMEDLQFVPVMETDITLENDLRKIIIDAKFYPDTMAINYEKERIKSANLYQLFSYLVNQERDDLKTLAATGILLYPTVTKEYDLHYTYKAHSVQIKTVDLSADWYDIEERLLSIIGEGLVI